MVADIETFSRVLCDRSKTLKSRFRALFALKNTGGPSAVQAIAKNFQDPSALLKHELAYCLGQMKDPSAMPILVNVISDFTQEPMVRHEAGEALAAIGNAEACEVLERFLCDSQPEVSETCELALARLQFYASAEGQKCADSTVFPSVDPAPPAQYASTDDVPKLRQVLLDTERTLWDRYRAMFALRDIGTDSAVCALNEALRCPSSALYRHEVAFVLGQLQSPLSVDSLEERLADMHENCMVRHEAAEALGAIANERTDAILRQYLQDPERVVKESCEVALDISDHARSNEFQYSDHM